MPARPAVGVTLVAAALLASSTLAPLPAARGNPLDAIRNKAASGGTLERLPDDNVEGTIWEYKGTLEKGELNGKKQASIAGTFRLEDGGIFAVGQAIRLPGKDDIEELIADLRAGRPKFLKLPGGTPKRIGDFKVDRSKRMSLNFDDTSDEPNALFGSMVLRPKKGSAQVFHGDFREKDGKKTVRNWQMTVRKVMD
ncbi:MAG: hypothetical protein AAGB00_06995 [Planctomycetota bacterium]